MNFDLVSLVPELDKLKRSTLDVMTPEEFKDLFDELEEKYKYRKLPYKPEEKQKYTWQDAINHLMIREYESDFVEWDIKSSQVEEVEGTIPGIIEAKENEGHHKNDGAQEEKRWTTGKESEFVVQNYTGFRFVDTKAYKNSKEAAGPDLIGRCGVKSSSLNNFPVIYRGVPKTPEIIVIKYAPYKFKIAGLFTPEMLMKYQEDRLVKTYSLRLKKSAVYHYGVGIKFGPGRENLSMLLYDLGY
jgi:hypothetical protein